MLRTDGSDRRVTLQSGFDQEEGTASSCADDSRRGAAKDVDGQILGFFIFEEQVCERLSHGLIKAKSAAVEQDLVDVGGSQTAVYAPDAFILDDDADAVDRAAVVLGLGALCLQFTLQLLSDLEDFGRMSDRYGSASRERACGETTITSLVSPKKTASRNPAQPEHRARGSVAHTLWWSTWPLAFRAAARQGKTTGERLGLCYRERRRREGCGREERLLGVNLLLLQEPISILARQTR